MPRKNRHETKSPATDPPPDSPAARIRAVRQRHHLTQQQAADELMVDRAYISVLENGHRQPSEAFLFRLAFLERVGSLADFREAHGIQPPPDFTRLQEDPVPYRAGPATPAVPPDPELDEITAPDDSMYPEVQSGDRLRLGTAPVRGAIAVVALHTGEILVRRWFPADKGRVTLRAESGTDPRTLEPGSWKWARAVRQLTRKY